jgi:predicted phosphodiesterase
MRGIPTVRGNEVHDLTEAGPGRDPSGRAGGADGRVSEIQAWGRNHLSPENLEWLEGLPIQAAIDPGLLVVHGGPGAPSLAVTEDHVDKQGRLLPPSCSAVCAGHLHVPFLRPAAWGLWVNAGSAGRPCDGDPRAALALLKFTGIGWEAAIHRVVFDLAEAARAIRASGIPHAERLVESQIRACWWRDLPE